MAIVDRGSIRAAARSLGIAQPAISRSVRELERELGVTLFERQPKGVVPTRLGELFIQRARAAQNELMRAVDEIDQLRGKAHGNVSACLSTAAHIGLLPDTLKPFRQRFPDVKLNLSEGLFPDAEAALKDSTIDFYVGPLPEQRITGKLIAEDLLENRRVIMARKGHPLAAATSLADLVDCEWITTSITVKAEHELGPLFERHGLPRPRITIQAHSALTMATVVAYSDILTMLPVQWTQFPWTESLLQKIDIKETLAAPTICIVRRANLPLTPAAEFLCDLLRRAASASRTRT